MVKMEKLLIEKLQEDCFYELDFENSKFVPNNINSESENKWFIFDAITEDGTCVIIAGTDSISDSITGNLVYTKISVDNIISCFVGN